MSYCSCIGLDLESAVEDVTGRIEEKVRELWSESEEVSMESIGERCTEDFLESYYEDEGMEEIDDELHRNIIDEIVGELDYETIREGLIDEAEYQKNPLGYHGLSERDFL